MRSFQSSVGGVGLGATGAPYWDYAFYDPRIQPVLTTVAWPVPGIYSYSPEIGFSVWHFEERPGNQLILKKEQGD
ncbi:MAG: hypothetical protein ACE5OR_14730 [bacterium]